MRVVLSALALLLLAACDTCEKQSCADWSGTSAHFLYVCSTSGSGSSPDVFTVLDENRNQVYQCTRPADDNTGCGVELISAKEAYCSSLP